MLVRQLLVAALALPATFSAIAATSCDQVLARIGANLTNVTCFASPDLTTKNPATTPAIRGWARRHQVELCLTPTNASWADPIEAQFGTLRSFTMANSDYPNHTVLERELQAYLRWRNANNRHPDVLAAQRRERARVRSERHQRWGRPRARAA